MKLKSWITAGIFCATCCLGVENSYAQMMYKQGELIELDCGPGSGFPQEAVEVQRGKKIAAGTPSDTEGPMANNKQNGPINATVYRKLGIAKTDAPGKMTWASAFLYCREQGDGWRLPTQRELQLVWIFKSALIDLGGNNFEQAGYWVSTEYVITSSWYVNFESGLTSASLKGNTQNVRCVREL